MTDINLLPLPDPVAISESPVEPLYSYSQMQDYATAAVLADREARARPFAWHMSGTSLIELATHETLPAEDLGERAKYGWRPLYLHPQPVEQRKPLSRDEVMRLANKTSGHHWCDEAHLQRLALAVQAAHGIKEAT